MSTLYLTQQDTMLRKVDERLKVTRKKETLLDLPLIKVSEVVIFGRVSVTGATVSALLERGIEICYLTTHGKYIGRLQPSFSKNSLLRVAQYKVAFDEAKKRDLARGFVLGKLANLRVSLQRASRREESVDLSKAIESIRNAEQGAEQAETLDQIRGHEGEGSAAYFSVFGALIKQEGFTFDKRIRRPPTDPINSLLSFGYTLLTNDLFSAVNTVGFDPYVGYLHADRYGRPSLPLDLMEEFRPLIVDIMVLTCINRGQITLEDFQKQTMGDVYYLTDEGRKKFLLQYEERKSTELQHPIFGYKTTYKKCFELQARLLGKVLQGELKAYLPLIRR
jgi:CRISPR-associated protein Cas1